IASKGGGHNPRMPMSAYRVDDALTIDQLLAASPVFYAQQPPVRSVHMLIKPAFQSETTCSMSNTGGVLQAVPHETSLAAAYDKLCGNFGQGGDPLAKQRAALKQTVLGRVHDKYAQLLLSKRLGADDRQRLDAHRQLLEDLDKSLGVMGASCTKPDPVMD